MRKNVEDVAEYIRLAPKEAQAKLRALRRLVRAAAPKAEEGISYGMPSYKHLGQLVYFAAFKNHVSLFPANTEAVRRFKAELKPYQTSAGTVRFPLDARLPEALITKIVKARVKQNEERSATRKRPATRRAASTRRSVRER